MILIQEDEGFVTPLTILSNITLVYKITKIVLLMKVKIPKRPPKDHIQSLDHVFMIEWLLIVTCYCGMKFADASLTRPSLYKWCLHCRWLFMRMESKEN